jgi:hypothetical protein
MTHINYAERGQPDGQHHNTHPVYHFQQLVHTTPLNATRPEPRYTHHQLAHAELCAPARKTIAQRARTQHPYPTHIPNRYYRHFQRYFHPERAFEHLLRHTLHECAPDQPYGIAVDGTTVPRTGKYIPGVHWTPDPADAPFARGLRWAQRFVVAGWLDNDPNARCVPIHCLPTFSPKARYANPNSRRSEIGGWMAGIGQVRAWLDAAGRAKQLLLCVGDGRGDTKALGQVDLPNVVCCVRTRCDSRGCDLPSEAATGRGRPRVYSDAKWTPQQKWRERRGWRRVPLTVRGRALRLLVKVLGPCRRVRWGARVFFVVLIRGHHKRTKRGKSREPMAFWVHAVSDGKGGWQLPVPLAVLLLKVWQRWEIEVGFRQMKSGFGLGQKPCWGLDSGERSVAWSAWVYGALVWSGYRAWGWTGGARWGGGRRRVRWTFRDVLWSVRCGLLGGGINGVLWGDRVCGAEALKNRGVLWCWGVDVVLSWLQAFRL